MLPIYVMYDSGIEPKEERAILKGLEDFSTLFPETKITIFGAKPWTSKEEAYSSADWYVSHTPIVLGHYGDWQLDGDYLLELMMNEPWQVANPHIDVFLTSKDMTVRDSGAQLNFVFGVASRRTTIQSVARFRALEDFSRYLSIKAVICHELGHVLGMASDPSRPHTEDNLGPHCTNFGCVMQQSLTVPAWAVHAHDAYTHGMYCPECMADAKHFISS